MIIIFVEFIDQLIDYPIVPALMVIRIHFCMFFFVLFFFVENYEKY